MWVGVITVPSVCSIFASNVNATLVLAKTPRHRLSVAAFPLGRLEWNASSVPRDFIPSQNSSCFALLMDVEIRWLAFSKRSFTPNCSRKSSKARAIDSPYSADSISAASLRLRVRFKDARSLLNQDVLLPRPTPYSPSARARGNGLQERCLGFVPLLKFSKLYYILFPVCLPDIFKSIRRQFIVLAFVHCRPRGDFRLYDFGCRQRASCLRQTRYAVEILCEGRIVVAKFSLEKAFYATAYCRIIKFCGVLS